MIKQHITMAQFKSKTIILHLVPVCSGAASHDVAFFSAQSMLGVGKAVHVILSLQGWR